MNTSARTQTSNNALQYVLGFMLFTVGTLLGMVLMAVWHNLPPAAPPEPKFPPTFSTNPADKHRQPVKIDTPPRPPAPNESKPRN